MRRWLAGGFMGLICLGGLRLPVAQAAVPVVRCGEQEFAALQDAIDAAQDGDTLVLLDDVRLAAPVICDKQLTLDGRAGGLIFGPNACLDIQGDLLVCNTPVTASRVKAGAAPFVLSRDHAALELKNCRLEIGGRDSIRDNYKGAVQAIQIDTQPAGGQDSPDHVSLTLRETDIAIPVSGAYAIACAGSPSGSTITLEDVRIDGAEDTEARRKIARGRALYVPDTPGADAMEITLDGCTLSGFGYGLMIGTGAGAAQISLSDTEITAVTPLSLSTEDACYTLTDGCTLRSQGNWAQPNRPYQIRLEPDAQDNTLTLMDTALEDTIPDRVGTAIGVYAAENALSFDADCTAASAGEIVFCDQLPEQLEVSPDMTFGAGYGCVIRDADGGFRNACSTLQTAQTLWQADDVITVTGEQAGAVTVGHPLTLLGGSDAALSGALAICSEGVTVHGFDLSACTLDCPPDTDISRNFWDGAPPEPLAAQAVPHYESWPDGRLIYPSAQGDAVLEEIERAIGTIEAAWQREGARGFADDRSLRQQLEETGDRLRQMVSLAQYTQAVQADQTLAARLETAWAHYRQAFPLVVGQTLLESALLPAAPQDARVIEAQVLDNPAGREQQAEIQADGMVCPAEDTVQLVLTLTGAEHGPDGDLIGYTAQVVDAGGTALPAGLVQARYRLPLSHGRAEQVMLRLPDGTEAQLEVAYDGGGYAMCSQLGSFTVFVPQGEPLLPPDGGQTDPPSGQTDPPDVPEMPETDAPQLILTQSVHGSLRLRGDAPEAAGEWVRIRVRPEPGYALEELTVRTGRGQIDYDLEDETAAFRMPDATTRVRAVFRRTDDPNADPALTGAADAGIDWSTVEFEPLPPVGERMTDMPFRDVQPTDWYYEAVRQLWQQGILEGAHSDQFAPYAPLPRAVCAVLLHRQAGAPQSVPAAFSDVPAGSWYAQAAGWAQANGILMGHPDGRFCPMQAVTREELIVILHRQAGAPAPTAPPPFADQALLSPWARAAAAWGAQHGLLLGDEWARMQPQRPVSRAEAAAILMRWQAMP